MSFSLSLCLSRLFDPILGENIARSRISFATAFRLAFSAQPGPIE